MKRFKKFLSIFTVSIICIANFSICNLSFAKDSPYDGVIQNTIKTQEGEGALKTAIDGGDVIQGETGSELFNNQVLKIIDYIIDIFIVVGIAIAFFGGYKIMTSDKEENLKEGIRLVVFGIIGIIIMVSAKFLASSLVGNEGIITDEFGGTTEASGPSGINFAENLYNTIMFPFIKVALYLVIGILFFAMVAKIISFVTATDDSAKKKAGGIIIWCVIGILIIMGSKQIVEAVMGKQNIVLNKNAEWISGGETGMGEEILEFERIPLIAQVINWVMGLTMFAIVILIIIQGYKIFTKPDDPKTRESLKKTILYIVIGILVIGAAYVISNVLVINNVPIDSSLTN